VVLLAWALVARSRDLTRAGLLLTVVCGVAAFLADQTGDRTKDQLEQLPWFTEDLVEEHEEAAEKTLIILGLAGAVALVGLIRMRGGRTVRLESGLALALVTFGGMAAAWTALEGGKIRHEEVRPGFVFPAAHDD
ncbi:MAG: hypothetical protein ABJB33_04320, partial [Gemmatimonadota bacterium]